MYSIEDHRLTNPNISSLYTTATMSFNWRRPFRSQEDGDDAGNNAGNISETDAAVLSDGSLQFTLEKGGNDSKPSYQEASGAPVERDSPLGYEVGPITILFLNISTMIGTGIYSTPSAILKGTGSVGAAFFFWALGFFTSLSKLAVWLEFAAYFPNRSGGEVAYLEQAYPRPKWLFPTAFAFLSVVLSFSSSNALVLSNYLFRINGHSPTPWELRGVAVAGYTVATLFVIFHTRYSYWVSNGIGIVKLLTLTFIGLTGLVVLGGHISKERIPDPHANFRNAFESLTPAGATGYGITNALYRIIFSYAGFEQAFNVVAEVKNPIGKLKRNAFLSLFIVTLLYIFANVAYFAAVPKVDLAEAKLTAASHFFVNVFGDSGSVRGLNFLVALSSFGNLMAVLLGNSRVIRECGRQGVLPFPRFWASTRPFGTPLGPYFVKWFLTCIMIIAPPAGDAFNFITSLQVFPNAFFNLLMGIGLYVVRYRSKRLNLPKPEFRAWDWLAIFNILVNTYLLVMPWYPPAGGQYAGDVSFWYATYAVTGIGIIIGCGIYYYLWVYGIPRLRGYRLRQQVVYFEDGAQSHHLLKVPVDQLADWDSKHDAVGRPLERSTATHTSIGVDNRSSDDAVGGEKSGFGASDKKVDPEK